MSQWRVLLGPAWTISGWWTGASYTDNSCGLDARRSSLLQKPKPCCRQAETTRSDLMLHALCATTAPSTNASLYWNPCAGGKKTDSLAGHDVTKRAIIDVISIVSGRNYDILTSIIAQLPMSRPFTDLC